MVIEILVLGGEERLHHPPRHGLDGHEDTLLDGVLGQQLPVAGVHTGHHRWLVIGKLGVIGEVASEVMEHEKRPARAEDGDNHQNAKDGGGNSYHEALNVGSSGRRQGAFLLAPGPGSRYRGRGPGGAYAYHGGTLGACEP